MNDVKISSASQIRKDGLQALEEIYAQMSESSADKKIDGKRDLVIETKELLDCLPEEDIALVNQIVKKLILAWDPDYTKVSFEEAEKIEGAEQEMKEGIFFTNKDVGF